MKGMDTIKPQAEFFAGAVSVEKGDGWLQPWRLPCDRLDLFPSPGHALVERAACASGVRLRLRTDSRRLGLTFEPLKKTAWNPAHALDLTIDGAIVATAEVPFGGSQADFANLPEGNKILEVWLPAAAPIRIISLQVEPGCALEAAVDERPRWVTYGSSLTHCARASGSARIWPAVVARERDWHLTALGFGGNCCLEPMIGMMIRELPADLITLKLGINCISGALSPRTFQAAVLGLVAIIREGHPQTPIGLISPIAYPPRETDPNLLNYTISGMRHDIEAVYQILADRGDRNLFYFNGLDLFSVAEIERYAEDQCHPNGEGIELMGRNFLQRIAPKLPCPAASAARRT